MDILILLVPLSVVLVLAIGIVFWLALRGGQFDDLESPGLSIVLDDDRTAAGDAEDGRQEGSGDSPRAPH